MHLTADDLPLQRFYHWERVQPNAIYLTQPCGQGVIRDYSWAQVGEQARRMAAYLRAQGWEPGARVAIIGKNSAHWVMADLAIWMAGYVSVPLYPTLTAESVRQVLEHSESRACFIGKLDAWPAMKAGIPEALPCIGLPLSPLEGGTTWEGITSATDPVPGSPTREGEDLATIIYTSGTTGMPKGVMHGFRAFAAAAKAGNLRFGARQGDRVLSYLPLSHIAERVAVETVSLIFGVHIYFAESLETFAADLRRARPTFFFSVPRLWVKFQQGVFASIPPRRLDTLLRVPLLSGMLKRKILRGLGLDHCRFAAGGAAPMPPDLLRWYARLGLEIVEVYGMTENCAMSHSNLPGQTRPGYVGMPYEGVESRLAENGEVQVRCGAMMLGYFKEPEKTREVLSADGWLSTGDLGELDERGRLRITGRAKELFKTSKGKYVAPAPIESRLNADSRIEACCVMGANAGQPFAVAILSPAEMAACRELTHREALLASLREFLQSVNEGLDAHEQLDFLAIVRDPWTVDNGFITPTMKVKRNIIEKTYEPHVDRWMAARSPVVWDA